MNFTKLSTLFGFQQKPKASYPDFKVGDKIRVHNILNEGKKQRIQMFEGLVISIKGFLNAKSFRVRKSTGDYSVEKIFFYNSPLISKIELLRQGKVRRAKLYYIRNLRGKAARIKELKKPLASQTK